MSKKRIAFLTLSFALMASLIGGALFGQATQKGNNSSIYRYLSTFSEVFDLVRSNYVDEVPSNQLLEGAFSGVTDAIDEFSYYVPPQQMAAFKQFVDVEDNSVGLVITKRFGYAFVVSAIPGSPAAAAGIERGDFIESIDGQSLQKLAQWQVRSTLANAAKRPFKMQIIRGGQTKREVVTVQPAVFHPLNLGVKEYDTVAVVTLPFFDKGSSARFSDVLADLRKRGTKKLIVDVRGNAGGDVDEAVRAADLLLSGGTITSLHGRKLDAKRWDADKATSFDGDVLVLTDVSTAAAGEIFAAAIQGNNRGKAVGVTTFGKSIYQRFVPLASGGGVQMTVGHYTTPDLKPIKELGVKPEVVVDLTADQLPDVDGHPVKNTDDSILRKALSMFGQTLPAPVAEKKAA